MTITPLPPLPTTVAAARYTADQMQAYATQARADLEAEVARLREALKRIETMCAAPPDFSGSTIQEVARATLEKQP